MPKTWVKNSGVVLQMTKRQARKVLQALEGPSVTDPVIAEVYELLKIKLEPGSKHIPPR